MKTYQSTWKKILARDLEGFREALQSDIFQGWEKVRHPDMDIRLALSDALLFRFADQTGTEFQQFLDRCILYADRCSKEKKFENRLCKGSFPLNRGVSLRAAAYARLLKSGELAINTLVAASADLESWCVKLDRSNWEEVNQQHFLESVHLAIIAGDLPRAQRLLSIKRSFRYHQKHFEMINGLCDALAQSPKPLQSKPLLRSFRVVFDRLRNPMLAEDVLAFELGIIQHLSFFSSDSSINLQEVIREVAR